LLNSLYDDRKSKQILFWRSMPVSETVNVLMKVFVVAIVAPTFLLCINQMVSLIFAILGSVFFFSVNNSSAVISPAITDVNAFFIPLEIYRDNLLGMLFMLPLIGYFLFVSAISRRFPMAIAFGVPMLLVLIDFLLGRINLTIGVISLLQLYKDMLVDIKSAFVLKEVFELQSDFIKYLVFSFGIGGLLIAASIWLRNNRYEI
jgi:ABC-2 type transport system permease protein